MNLKTFSEYFNGTLGGVMNRERYVELAARIGATANKNWYAVQYSSVDPVVTELDGATLEKKLLEMQEDISARKLMSSDYPWTYAANREDPEFVKTYDPQQCGDTCSISRPPPWWVFSTVRPLEIEVQNLMCSRLPERKGIMGRMKKVFS